MSGLEELLANATPGPWRGEVDSILWSGDLMVGGFEKWQDAVLAALAPDLARLALDMGEALRLWNLQSEAKSPITEELLARLDGLAAGEET